MAKWSFYGRTGTLETLDKLVHGPAWFFCRIQGRRRIGKTTLLRELSKFDETLLSRMVYMQIPDSDERDVAASAVRSAIASPLLKPAGQHFSGRNSSSNNLTEPDGY